MGHDITYFWQVQSTAVRNILERIESEGRKEGIKRYYYKLSERIQSFTMMRPRRQGQGIWNTEKCGWDNWFKDFALQLSFPTLSSKIILVLWKGVICGGYGGEGNLMRRRITR